MTCDSGFTDRLRRLALQVFESEAGAERWLNSPQLGLRGAVPLVYADTEERVREVECLLWQIDFGIPP